MDIVGTIGHEPLVDLGIFLALFAAFVIGVMQGSIRRLLGILSILFSFLLAANLRDSVGDFLAGNWTQFPRDYNRLLAFVLLFGVGTVALSVIIQGFYKRTDIYAAHPIVDDIIGGLLGLVEGVVILMVLVVIVDSYTLPAPRSGDLAVLRQVQDLVHQSAICGGVKDVLAPTFVHVLGLLLPSDLTSVFP
jgi:uncharacterized membrane protein required for colicin V production